MIKCDCGQELTEKDVCVVEQAPADYYPYEGSVYTFICPKCSYLTVLTETDIEKAGGF